jgi:ATP-dependent Clp protease adaptor protein ClpS
MVNKPDQTDGDVHTIENPTTEIRDKLKEPPKHAVVLHNDDYTTMEFVVEVLKKFFQKTEAEAMAIMLRVHEDGKGVAGIFSYEIAETKAVQVDFVARGRGYPLKCTVEPLK